MAAVLVSNISDRPNTSAAPASLVIGGQKLRPGQSITIDDAVLNDRHRAMQGSVLWIGTLPRQLTQTSRAALALQRKEEQAAPSPRLTLEQAREYLSKLDVPALLALAAQASPPVEFSRTPSQPAAVARLSRALFQEHRELDPEVFGWLGRWVRVRGGYTQVE